MSQLRSFKAFTNTAPVQPLMPNGLVVPTPCNLVDLDGSTAASAGWFQILDKATAPTGGEVPLKSFQITSAGPLPSLFQTLGPITITNGLWLAMSSTEATFTNLASNFDVFGEVDEFEIDITIGKTSIGDLTTARSNLPVWNEVAGLVTAKRLYRLIVINGTASPLFPMVFAKNNGNTSTGDKPFMDLMPQYSNASPPGLAAGATGQFNFGDGGIAPGSFDTIQSGNIIQVGTFRQGCTIQCSTTAGTLTQSAASNNIQAWFL